MSKLHTTETLQSHSVSEETGDDPNYEHKRIKSDYIALLVLSQHVRTPYMKSANSNTIL